MKQLDELKNLQLTENDFQLLIDGLDELPNKGTAGDLMIGLLGSMLVKDDPDAKAKFLAEREQEKLKKEREKQFMIENVRILQGKLLMMKRVMQMNGLLKEAENSIANNMLDTK